MSYVKRNDLGKITGVNEEQSDEYVEYLEGGNAELISFFTDNGFPQKIKDTLFVSDGEMVRVIDDLIHLLVEKEVFVFTELPEAVQEKLNSRSKMRAEINPLGDLVGESDEIF
ncbi:MAG: hypothetical protein GQ581_04975 [Methyloprofundus sp.]|nr:hypothetical protein [Methyloprofundus sp.]